MEQREMVVRVDVLGGSRSEGQDWLGLMGRIELTI